MGVKSAASAFTLLQSRETVSPSITQGVLTNHRASANVSAAGRKLPVNIGRKVRRR